MDDHPSRTGAGAARGGALRLLVADDLTGAADACVKFVAHGYDGRVVLGADSPVATSDVGVAGVVAVNADTRRRTSEEAQARVHRTRDLVSASPDAVVFKKIDSSLRGHVGIELVAALDTFECTHAIVAPSFPTMGRIVRDGWLTVEGSGASPACEVRALLANQGVVGCVSIGQPGEGPPSVRMLAMLTSIAQARDTGARVMVFDAVSDSDLGTIVDAAIELGGRPLWVGSAGLASALASRLAAIDRPVPSPPRHGRANRRVLFLIGSTHPATCAQQQYLSAERHVSIVEAGAAPARMSEAWRGGHHVLLRVDSQQPAVELVQVALATLPHHALAHEFAQEFAQAFAGLVLSGGDTAADVCAALGATSIRLGGEVANGIPWGLLEGGRDDGLPVVLKSGAFGDRDALAGALDFLSSRPD